MKRFLLDTSAMLTLRDDEPGADLVAAQLRDHDAKCFACFVTRMVILQGLVSCAEHPMHETRRDPGNSRRDPGNSGLGLGWKTDLGPGEFFLASGYFSPPVETSNFSGNLAAARASEAIGSDRPLIFRGPGH